MSYDQNRFIARDESIVAFDLKNYCLILSPIHPSDRNRSRLGFYLFVFKSYLSRGNANVQYTVRPAAVTELIEI